MFKTVINKRLEQFQSHFFRQAALVKPQIGSDGNHGTARVIDTFTQQILTKSSLFTFQGITERFQRTLVGTGNHTTMTAIVKQDINGFLQHPFFIANDNIRGF